MLDARSERCLATLDPRLAAVVRRAHELEPLLQAIEGRRTLERQHELYGQGRTATECTAAGVDPKHARPDLKKVTWTLKSNHFSGRAVDVWPGRWDDLKLFDRLAAAMFQAAAEHGVALRWGADWDRDGKPRERGESDSPHFELAD